MKYTVAPLMILFALARTLASKYRLPEVLSDMLLKESYYSNLHLFLDFTEPTQAILLEKLVSSDVPITVHNVLTLRTHQEKHRLPLKCPVFQFRQNMSDSGPLVQVGQNEIYQRHQLVTADPRSPMTIVTWVSSKNISTAILIFESEVLWCKQKVDMGLLNKNNRLIFVVQNRNDTKNIFSSPYISNHPYVASMAQVNNHLKITVKDFYLGTTQQDSPTLSKVMSPDSYLWQKSLYDIYNQQKSFKGKIFNVLNIPLAYFAQATFVNDAESPIKLFKDRWGLTIDIITALQEKLDFKVKFFNPDPIWDLGRVDEVGSWTGGTGMIHDHTCDLILDWGMDFDRSQVVDLVPYNYLDYESFVSPGPRPKSKIFTITSPFGRLVWICVLLSVPVMATTTYILAIKEGGLLKRVIKPWMSIGESVWYAFGTLQGESITRNINITSIYALRWSVGAWMLYCLVIGASYSSNLKSHLTTPELVPSLDSMEEIVNGNLPWKYPVYYTAEEEIMASMENPVHKKFWNDKITLHEYSTPLYDVQRGEAVRFDWLSELKLQIATKHSASDGKMLVHLGSEPILFIRYVAVMFRPGVPWIDQFSELLGRISDSGLIWYWESKVLRELRSQEESVVITASDVNDCLSQEISCPLILEHYHGTLIFYAILSLMAMFVFMFELCQRSSDRIA